MRISDWSSDVCSSDLGEPEGNNDLAKAEEQRLSVTETLEITDVSVLAIFLRRCHLTKPCSLGTYRHHRLHIFGGDNGAGRNAPRSEERRAGKECVSTGRSRWSPLH